MYSIEMIKAKFFITCNFYSYFSTLITFDRSRALT